MLNIGRDIYFKFCVKLRCWCEDWDIFLQEERCMYWSMFPSRRNRGLLTECMTELWMCRLFLHGCWRFVLSPVPMLVMVVVIVTAFGWLVGRCPERSGPHHEHDHGQHHPSHRHQRERVVGAATVGTASQGVSAILAALVVCAMGLGLSEEVEEPSHGHLMAENAFARVEVTTVCHLGISISSLLTQTLCKRLSRLQRKKGL